MLMKYKQGFTLLEVTVALTIFSVGLIALLSLFPHGVRVLKRDVHDQMTHVAAYSVARSIQAKGKTNLDMNFFDRIQSYRSDNENLNTGIFVLNGQTGKDSPLFDIEYKISEFHVQKNHYSADIVLKNKDNIDGQYTYQSAVLEGTVSS